MCNRWPETMPGDPPVRSSPNLGMITNDVEPTTMKRQGTTPEGNVGVVPDTDGSSLVALSYCIDHWADAETECHSACNGPECRFCGSMRKLEAWVTVGHPRERDLYLRSIECSACLGYECCNLVCPCCLQNYKYFAALLQTCTTLRDIGLGPPSDPCRRLTLTLEAQEVQVPE